MKKVWNAILRMGPARLRNRLLLSFALLILIPYTILQIWNYSEIENLIKSKIGVQNQAQVDNLAQEFETMRTTLVLSALQMANNERVWRLLSSPSQESKQNEEEAGSIFDSVLALFPKTSAYINLTLIDNYEELYTSYAARSSRKAADVESEEGFRKLAADPNQTIWEIHPYADLGKVNSDASSKVTSIYLDIHDGNNRPVGKLRFTIEFENWLRTSIRTFPILQDYHILDADGHSVFQTSAKELQALDPVNLTQEGGYINQSDSSILNAAQVRSMNWIIVSKFPLGIFFGDLSALKNRFLVSFLLITAIFIIITFFILSTITRPLNLLEQKMKDTVRRNLNVQIPEESHRGELLSLAQSFNQMIQEMGDMVRKLKTEERQREALRFQMLLAQMNPHFLLNTLNTMKWTAHEGNAEAVEEMCVSLCLLLESSLRSDVEMIYLKDELELLEAYLYIQNVRFDGKFQVNYSVESGLEYALVPKLSLQPLAENAIQHGLAPRSGVGNLKVIVRSEEKRLLLTIEDNGVGLEQARKVASSRKRNGIGLSNLKERLQLLFREQGGLQIAPMEEGTQVAMTLPLLLSNPVRQGGDNDVEDSIG